ncbi:beta-lactamase family protein [Pelagicoccus sp. NFK12]|uniref:Beta-lactamase family protein n=1 Tax=Pelagicoccus enzymogenes TaxID=2773457 RepID=A0A927F4R9_9BACT|nr:serine hydrolase domain-containing protein [Pelagicoccus enzymogenes]MBD5778373.1 beta-lactamase family protein [Pelagicoccus enzymogenes]
MKNKKIKWIVRIALLLGTVVSLFFVPWILVWAWILPLPNSVQEQLDEAIGHGFEGMIVYVNEAGKPPAFYGAGWHDREDQIAADPQAFFKIASISKLYDAVAVSKLVDDGRLSLDRTLAEYFPELGGRIENAERITLRLMVQHRSGIPNFTDTPNFWANPPESGEDALKLILDKPANFEPGEGYEYSNTNYLLLSQIVEKVLGYSKFQFIEEKILNPLGLKNTYASHSEVNADRLMSGYHVGHPHDLKMDEHGMVATAEDVGIFLRALNDGSLFNENERAIYASIYVYKHSGWVPGYQSFAEYHEDLDTVVVQFYNTTDSKLYLWNVAEIVNGRIVKLLRKQRR